MMGTDYPENILPDDDGVSFLGSVTPVLAAADIAFGNLEGVLMDGGEAVKRCKPAAKSKATTKAGANTPATARGVTAPSATAPRVEAGPPPAAPTAAAATALAPGDAASPANAERGDDSAIAAVPVEESGSDKSVAPVAPTVPAAPAAPGVASTDVSTSSGTPAPVPTSTTPPAPDAPGAPPPPASADTSTNPAPTGGACFVFRSPTRYATYLRDAGFDVMSLANNHAQDFGDPGRASSMQALDGVGIHHSGRDGDVAQWTTRGKRFAMVAFAPNVGSHQFNDLARARQIVTDLASKNDIVIVSFHGGAEGDGASKLPFARELYAGEDRGDVVEFSHAVVDAGADLVIGHGPHVMRAMELYRDRLIAYSLGNFATYYGISVNGVRGTSGVLTTRIADDGRFIDARFTPTVQIRPGGPQPDPAKRALIQLRSLTEEAFPAGALALSDDGVISRKQ
jgi:hypothetical protein